MNKLRILYVPNESDSFRQLGFRRPLANLLGAALVADVSIFSLQWRIRNGGDAEQHRRDLVERVQDFQPNLVLMQHLGWTGMRAEHFRAMRRVADFEFVYHEADPYSRRLHPLPRAARLAGRYADVVYTVGSGTFSNNFRRAGAADVRWAPSPFEPERFMVDAVDEALIRKHDVVVVANKNQPRWRGLPNWRDRIAFIEHLQDVFGSRLAIFGRGWSGVGTMGPVDFSEQMAAIRSGWISANWDHFALEPSYFSNRLPISLAAGSIHATTRHAGYEDLFPKSSERFLILGDSHAELSSAMERYLRETSPSDRIDASREAQVFANDNFRQDDQMVTFLNSGGRRVDPQSASDSWTIDSPALDEL